MYFKGKNLDRSSLRYLRRHSSGDFRKHAVISLVLGEVGIWMVFKVRSLAKIRNQQKQRRGPGVEPWDSAT